MTLELYLLLSSQWLFKLLVCSYVIDYTEAKEVDASDYSYEFISYCMLVPSCTVKDSLKQTIFFHIFALLPIILLKHNRLSFSMNI